METSTTHASGGTPASVRDGAVPNPLEDIDYRLIGDGEDREDIYRLRYRAYLKEGAVMPSPSERVTDRFDDDPATWIFGVYLNDRLISSIRISLATPQRRTAPCVDAFGDLLHPELDRGMVYVDSTRFVAEPDLPERIPFLPMVTARLGGIAGLRFRADYGVAMVRPEHRAFYRRYFMQEAWTEPRPYPGLTKPVGIMRAHYPSVRAPIQERFPVMRSSAFERRMLFPARPGVPEAAENATAAPTVMDGVAAVEAV